MTMNLTEVTLSKAVLCECTFDITSFVVMTEQFVVSQYILHGADCQ